MPRYLFAHQSIQGPKDDESEDVEFITVIDKETGKGYAARLEVISPIPEGMTDEKALAFMADEFQEAYDFPEGFWEG